MDNNDDGKIRIQRCPSKCQASIILRNLIENIRGLGLNALLFRSADLYPPGYQVKFPALRCIACSKNCGDGFETEWSILRNTMDSAGLIRASSNAAVQGSQSIAKPAVAESVSPPKNTPAVIEPLSVVRKSQSITEPAKEPPSTTKPARKPPSTTESSPAAGKPPSTTGPSPAAGKPPPTTEPSPATKKPPSPPPGVVPPAKKTVKHPPPRKFTLKKGTYIFDNSQVLNKPLPDKRPASASTTAHSTSSEGQPTVSATSHVASSTPLHRPPEKTGFVQIRRPPEKTISTPKNGFVVPQLLPVSTDGPSRPASTSSVPSGRQSTETPKTTFQTPFDIPWSKPLSPPAAQGGLSDKRENVPGNKITPAKPSAAREASGTDVQRATKDVENITPPVAHSACNTVATSSGDNSATQNGRPAVDVPSKRTFKNVKTEGPPSKLSAHGSPSPAFPRRSLSNGSGNPTPGRAQKGSLSWSDHFVGCQVAQCFNDKYYSVSAATLPMGTLRYNTTNKASELSIRSVTIQSRMTNDEKGITRHCICATVYFPPNNRATYVKILINRKTMWTATKCIDVGKMKELSKDLFINLPGTTPGENIWIAVYVGHGGKNTTASMPICYKYYDEGHPLAKKMVTHFETDIVTLD